MARKVRRVHQGVRDGGQRPTRGSRPLHDDDDDRRKGAGCLWPLLGLLLLALIAAILIFVVLNDDDDPSSGITSTSAAGRIETTVSTPDTAEDGVGTSAAGAQGTGLVSTDAGESILPVPNGGLEAFAGEDVAGASVPVELVVSDEGFWIGESADERIFVKLDIAGESPFQVTAGEPVTIKGTLEPLSDGPESLGVTDEEGSALLASQGHYVLVSELDRG